MMWPEERCNTCARTRHNLSGPCRAQTMHHERFCELSLPEHPDYNPQYEMYLCDEPIPVPEPEPGLAEKALTFMAALAEHAAAGFPSVDEETHRSRLETCEACENFRPNRSCVLCGCNMDLKSKWAEQQCPIGKWEAVHDRR